MPAERVYVVYPGVSADYCRLVRRPGGARTILVPGTVERRKNLEVLIRALPLLPDDVRLVSVGPATPYRAECERFARNAGVADRVEFRGYVDRTRLLELYATCAMVAVPSRYEGFGYAAAQAVCAATPVIVSSAASLPEVTGDTAQHVEPEDEHAWARAIAALLRDADARNARAAAAREAAVVRFSWDAAARATRGVYETALRSSR